MKKNMMMRLASGLLVAVLLTTCAISGTFAKYVTEASGTNSARVAKWGVEISGMGNDLFAQTYAKDSSTTIDNTVSATENVVAPGTKNEEGVTFSLTGTPEVAVKIDVVVKGSTTDTITDVVLPAGEYTDWTQAPYEKTFTTDAAYNPVVFTLKDGEKELASGTLAEIETFLENKSGEYAPGTNLAEIYGGASGTYTLTWAWDFENNRDKEDTLLGNIAAGTDNTVADASTKIDFAIAITATQID